MFFFVFFLFFSVRQKYENRSRERLNGFSQRHATAWRMANVDDLRNLRYDSGAITRARQSPRTAVAL